MCDQLYVGQLGRIFRPFQWLVSCQKSGKNPAIGNVFRLGFRIGPGVWRGLELGCLFEGQAEIAGVEPPHLFRDRGHLVSGQAKGQSGVTDGAAATVRVCHRHERYPVFAERVEDGPVDVVPPGGLDIQVDIWECLTFGGEEPFPEQPVGEGLHRRGVQGVVQDGPDAGAARLNPDGPCPG